NVLLQSLEDARQRLEGEDLRLWIDDGGEQTEEADVCAHVEDHFGRARQPVEERRHLRFIALPTAPEELRRDPIIAARIEFEYATVGQRDSRHACARQMFDDELGTQTCRLEQPFER